MNKVINEYNEKIKEKQNRIIQLGKKLEEESDGEYLIEKSIILNRISLKNYLLNSPCCKSLEEENIVNYTASDLKNYLIKSDSSPTYLLALSLYFNVNELKDLIDEKIDKEIDIISKYDKDINKVKIIDKNEINDLYNNIMNSLSHEQKRDKLKILLEDIIDFYLNGYPLIKY